MTGTVAVGVSTRGSGLARRIAVLAMAAMTGACSSLGDDTGLDLLASSQPPAAEAAPGMGGMLQTELAQATDYWGKKYAKNPQDAQAALSYAKNLKALGRKSEAFQVLQQAAQFNNQDKQIASEYGRLALELDQTSLAEQLLAFADDPLRPDWRVMSARGAALAKQGKYKEAVQHLERANQLAPDRASVQNNLALAYAMSGDPQRAEGLLRQAVSRDSSNVKTRQNLALVLGLQGKYDEATQVGATAVSLNEAKQNTALVRQMVKLDPKKGGPSFTAPPAIAAAPAPAAPVAAATVAFKPANVDNTAAGSWSPTVVSTAN
jgi:Flp pilus assembly protein TadD